MASECISSCQDAETTKRWGRWWVEETWGPKIAEVAEEVRIVNSDADRKRKGLVDTDDMN